MVVEKSTKILKKRLLFPLPSKNYFNLPEKRCLVKVDKNSPKALYPDCFEDWGQVMT